MHEITKRNTKFIMELRAKKIPAHDIAKAMIAKGYKTVGGTRASKEYVYNIMSAERRKAEEAQVVPTPSVKKTEPTETKLPSGNGVLEFVRHIVESRLSQEKKIDFIRQTVGGRKSKSSEEIEIYD